MSLPLPIPEVTFLNRRVSVLWFLVLPFLLSLLLLTKVFPISWPNYSRSTKEATSSAASSETEKSYRYGGSDCPRVPLGYHLKEAETKEYVKTTAAKWGGAVTAAKGHWEDGAITPAIELLSGEYVFFAERPYRNGEGGAVFLGRTTEPLKWLKCYAPTPKGSVFVTVFENPPEAEDLKGTRLEAYPGLRGWVLLMLEWGS